MIGGQRTAPLRSSFFTPDAGNRQRHGEHHRCCRAPVCPSRWHDGNGTRSRQATIGDGATAEVQNADGDVAEPERIVVWLEDGRLFGAVD